MKITTEYAKSELRRRKCKSCGDKTLVYVSDFGDNKFDGWCPDCIEAYKFEEMTTKDL